MRALSTVKFTALRMLRRYTFLLLYLVSPMIMLTVLSVILSGAIAETTQPIMNSAATIMVLSAQLFGGSIVMAYIYTDFFTEFKTRLYSLPFNQTMYAFSIMICGTVFSMLLGVVLMTFTQFVLGVEWGNWLWTIYIIALMAILSSIVCLIITFSVQSYKLSEGLSGVYGFGLIILTGIFFPLPDNAFFEFMGSYGNPLALSLMSINEMNQANAGLAWLQATILLAVIVILFIVMLVVGRRRIA
ncbi:ABC transporter permease [Paenibacillus eucommiae]|uniref:ABC-2 type transport system permease protein n=1 Tax=Paenibacillus eucommiae TaxID=1355755 RepID=A0ABS4IQQ5_9BACL|nr:ABC transporter permease [Paenibacillus eucommiae]MBP1989848.1 ABC-2 type transport system permease protein [Paenibacillus eucommiae]